MGWLQPSIIIHTRWKNLQTSTSISFDKGKGYTVTNTDYDWNSIMTYKGGYAHTNRVCFGSLCPNLINIWGVKEVYPPPQLSIHDVGVIPNKKSACPDGKLINIYMDNKDSNNHDLNNGWLGAIIEGCNEVGSSRGKGGGRDNGTVNYSNKYLLY